MRVEEQKTFGGCKLASGELAYRELVSENVVTSRCTEKLILCSLENLRPWRLAREVGQTAGRGTW